MPETSTRARKGAHAALAGGLCGVLSGVVLQPFDVVKTNLQQRLGRHPIGRPTNVRSLDIIRILCEKDGVKGLWRGTSPTVLRLAVGSSFYFWSISVLTDALAERASDVPQAAQAAIVGATARGTAGVVVAPLTLAKTQLEAGHGTSTFAVLREVQRTSGLGGYFRGIGPTLIRDAPASGIYLAMYRFLCDRATRADGSLSPTWRFLSGGVAGAAAAAITHPFDVVKTVLQAPPQGFRGEPQRFVPALQYVLRTAGWKGLLRGFTPRLAKRGISFAFTWTLYEEVLASIRALR